MTDLLIVDDHEIVRAGIRRLVENTPNLNIVADLGSGEEAYQFLQKNIARGGSDFQSRAESVAAPGCVVPAGWVPCALSYNVFRCLPGVCFCSTHVMFAYFHQAPFLYVES